MARMDLARRPTAVIILSFLIAVLFGGAIASATGARRSATAMDRFVAFTRPEDVNVSGDRAVLRKVDKLPEVASSLETSYVALSPTDVNGKPQLDQVGVINPFVFAPEVGTRDAQTRTYIVAGRDSDPTKPLDAVIDEQVAAERHIGVGSKLHMIAWSAGELTQLQFLAGDQAPYPHGPDVVLNVVGIGRHPWDVDVGQPSPEVLFLGSADIYLTPAFLAKYGGNIAGVGDNTFAVHAIRLINGSKDIPSFTKAVHALPGGPMLGISTTSETRSAAVIARRAIAIETGALWALSLAFLIAGLLITIPGLSRLARGATDDLTIARQLGITTEEAAGVAATPGLVVSVAGPLLAGLGAVGASPLTPISLARKAEEQPGVRFDPVIVVPSVLALVLMLVAASVLTGRLTARRVATGSDRAAERALPRRLRWARPLPSVLGVGIAARRTANATPLRGAAAALLLAVMTVTAVSLNLMSLNHLVSTPSTQGWTWDFKVGNPNNPYDATSLATLEMDPNVAGVLATTDPDAQAVINGHSVQVGVVTSGIGNLTPSMIQGRLPRSSNEIVLGHKTLDAAGAHVGDRVSLAAGGQRRSLTVVGSAVLNQEIAAGFTLGDGALVTSTLLTSINPGYTPNYNGFLVSLKPGVDHTKAFRELRQKWGRTVLLPRSTDTVETLARVRNLPVLFAALLTSVSLVLLIWTLAAGVRRRTSDFLIFRAVGSSRGQRGWAVGWQTIWITAIAFSIGIPLGVVVGRVAWHLVATSLGTLAGTHVLPSKTLTVYLVWIVGIALVTTWPALSAARVHRTDGDRDE